MTALLHRKIVACYLFLSSFLLYLLLHSRWLRRRILYWLFCHIFFCFSLVGFAITHMPKLLTDGEFLQLHISSISLSFDMMKPFSDVK